MTEATISTYADQMLNDMRAAVELVHLPGGLRDFECDLLAAESANVSNIAALARLISLAHAAFVVADAGVEGVPAPWYRHIGQRLLHRSMDALAVIEAYREPRPLGGLN